MPEVAIFFRRERLPFHVKDFARRMPAFQYQKTTRFHPVAQTCLLFFRQRPAVVFQQQRILVRRGKLAARLVVHDQLNAALIQKILRQRIGTGGRQTRPAAPDLFFCSRAGFLRRRERPEQQQRHRQQPTYQPEALVHTPCHSVR